MVRAIAALVILASLGGCAFHVQNLVPSKTHPFCYPKVRHAPIYAGIRCSF